MAEKKAQTPEEIIAAARRERALKENSYRERALKLFPHVCARCGRELSGKRLRELTVHHKDHNHDNNPPDGSNWELLCIYCHDNEHARDQVAEWYTGAAPEPAERPPVLDSPFAKLGDLLKEKK
jgi:5-methylcytosine-specific restriction endonuclease McrA